MWQVILRQRQLSWTWCCDGIFHDRGDAVAAAEIVMVVKYCNAIVLFSYIDTGMLLSVAPCNATGNSTTVKLVDRKIIPQLTITCYALKIIS
jgi:hypothetical protein